MLDAIDLRILDILQNDGRITNVELAARVGLTPGPTLSRVNKLEDAGFIERYAAIVDRSKVGMDVTAFVSVILRHHGSETAREFLDIACSFPEVLECHHIAGDEDYLLKVVAASPKDYERFVLERLTGIESVQRVKTIFVLSTAKTTTSLPVTQGLDLE